MSSITVFELKNILNRYPDDAEVLMQLHHRYDISKESGTKGWIAMINGIEYREDFKELRLMN